MTEKEEYEFSNSEEKTLYLAINHPSNGGKRNFSKDSIEKMYLNRFKKLDEPIESILVELEKKNYITKN